MTLDIETTLVTIPNQSLQIDAYLAKPITTETRLPAVIVIQEIFGVNHHIRDVTERIAKLGYLAIAPAMYQRQHPGFELGYTPETIKQGRELKAQTQTEEILSDLNATIQFLDNYPDVKLGGVGMIGFCFGGWIAYLGATLPQVNVTASFYGAGIPHWAPSESPPPITRTNKIQGKLYAFFGEEDASIPPADITLVEQALKAHQVEHKIFRYPRAGHGFFCDQRDSYNAAAAASAWEKVQTLLAELTEQ